MDLALVSKVVDEPEDTVLSCGHDEKHHLDSMNQTIGDSLERLNSAKRELAIKLREIVALKRQLDDIPTESELIQYEHRFSELYADIQRKHGQTRKLYATFNVLSEIKDLMLKETSLLNSINSQFQDAIASPAGRLKLTDSMEQILSGTQQKLDKVQLALQSEERVRDAVKAKYAAAITEQRSGYTLLKAFQEECGKNERLRKQINK